MVNVIDMNKIIPKVDRSKNKVKSENAEKEEIQN
jgi:hypothetical protein